MVDIFHYFPINASPEKVFECISTPKGIDTWWSEEAKGKVGLREVYELFFGEDYHWAGIVSKYTPSTEFELTMTKSDDDWAGSKLGFRLIDKDRFTQVEFYHIGWKEDNEHYRISNYCWAMYLRLLKRYIEHNEQVPYEQRLDV
jgi:uncharacterized protein YndB with AHSA1/START domain